MKRRVLGPAADPFYSKVKLLCHFDNGFQDSSARKQSLTNSGTTIDTVHKKFGLASAAFNGAAILSSTSSDFAFGTQDVTVEFFAFLANTASGQNLFDTRPNGGGIGICMNVNATLAGIVDGASGSTGTISLTSNTWYHFALSRNSGTSRLSINGALALSVSTPTNWTTASMTLGASLGGAPIVGNIDEARITVGVGRYPSAFTAPFNSFVP